MTNYIDNTKKEPKKVKKKTIFKKFVYKDRVEDPISKPEDWKNLKFIGHDRFYGDVFKAWDDNPEEFIIYFGEKGDEFE